MCVAIASDLHALLRQSASQQVHGMTSWLTVYPHINAEMSNACVCQVLAHSLKLQPKHQATPEKLILGCGLGSGAQQSQACGVSG